MSKETEWNDRFKIGVDSIDNAHRKLFSIVRKLFYQSENKNHGQWACAEGIKYFKNYAIEHFANEEAYMLSIGYKEYELHKQLHDNMRYKTLPALEKELSESNYSPESIHHFLGICLGWLTVHIMIEDRAITGKTSNKWRYGENGKDIQTLEDALADTIREIFKLQTDIVSEHYSGDNFGESIISRLVYETKEGPRIQIFLVLEESLVLRTVSSMLDMPLKKTDKLVLNTVRELAVQIVNHVGMYFHPSSQYQLVHNHIMTMEQFRQEFYTESFNYSMLLNTGMGYLAFCIHSDQLPPAKAN